MRFTVFNRWGTQTGVATDVIGAIHKDELNGEDSLTLTLATCDLIKGDRIVWQDKFGLWHEHIVNDIRDLHEDNTIQSVVYCETSLNETYLDYIEDLRPQNVSATVGLQKALSVTRWTVGTVEPTGTSSAMYYHISSREAQTIVTERWGGEFEALITISDAVVAGRTLNLLNRRGADNGKRFEWTKDIRSIERRVYPDDVCTALYGYGKGLEIYDDDGNLTGGYTRKLTFGDINGGLDYVYDDTAKATWGTLDANGVKQHAFGRVEFPECEDMHELKSLTLAELDKRKQPQVTYTASVLDLADIGYQFEDVRTGDTVAIIDDELGVELQGRVLCVQRNLFNESATVITLGNITRSINDVLAKTATSVSRLTDHSGAWDGAASLSTSYINAVIDNLNSTINVTGGYVYMEPGEGIVVYDRARDDNPTMAIQLCGAGFRIANSKTSQGTWNWRTFGTGNGFTADEIIAGVIRGGQSYWNLNTGDMVLGQGVSVGSGATVDGGSLTAGTVNASAINASSGTFSTANIPNLDAAKITSGYINSARIESGSITADKIHSGAITADKIAVGAVVNNDNLVRGTKAMTVGSGKWDTGTFRLSGTGTLSHISRTNLPVADCTRVIRITNDTGADISGESGFAQDVRRGPKVGETFTMSVWLRASTATQARLQIMWNGSGNIAGNQYVSVTTSWQRFSFSATLAGTQQDYYSIGYCYAVNLPNNAWMEACGLKIERGSTASAWTEAAEDTVVSSRNLLLNTGVAASKASTSVEAGSYTTHDPYTLTAAYSSLGLAAGDPLTVSFDMSITGAVAGTTVRVGTNATPWEYFGVLHTFGAGASTAHIEGHYTATSTLTACAGTTLRLRVDCPTAATVSWTISNAKLEKGSVATDWTPAPENMGLTTVDSSGISIYANAAAKTAGTYQRLTATDQTFYRNGVDVANYGSAIRIGKANAENIQVGNSIVCFNAVDGNEALEAKFEPISAAGVVRYGMRITNASNLSTITIAPAVTTANNTISFTNKLDYALDMNAIHFQTASAGISISDSVAVTGSTYYSTDTNWAYFYETNGYADFIRWRCRNGVVYVECNMEGVNGAIPTTKWFSGNNALIPTALRPDKDVCGAIYAGDGYAAVMWICGTNGRYTSRAGQCGLVGTRTSNYGYGTLSYPLFSTV